MTLITSTSQLLAASSLWQGVTAVAIDTEFVRLRTYFPELCLLQIASERGAIAIDPFASGMDLSCVWALCQDPHIVKIFHAGQQDIEIIFRASGSVPFPIFDTQIAGMALGLGESIGYQRLVQHYLDITLDKTHQYMDWSARPLSSTQITYALADVIHLHALTPKMMEELQTRERMEWIQEELAALALPVIYPGKLSQIWQRYRKLRHPKPVLERMKQLVWLRENLAITHDLPRAAVMSDRAMEALALLKNPEKSQLVALLAKYQSLVQSREMLLPLLLQPLPPLPQEEAGSPHYAFPSLAKERFKSLQSLLREVADTADIVPRLIAQKSQLEQLALDPAHAAVMDLPCLRGWRRALFGERALALMAASLEV